MSSIEQSNKLKNTLPKICFSNAGKGRMSFSGHNHVFDYEILVKTDQITIGIDVPLQGERVLIIQKKKKGVLLKGDMLSLYLSQKDTKEVQLLKKWPVFLFGWMSWIQSVQKKPEYLDKTCRLGRCHAPLLGQFDWEYDFSNSAVFTKKIPKDSEELQIQLSHLMDSKFSRMTLNYQGKEQNFKLILFPNECI